MLNPRSTVLALLLVGLSLPAHAEWHEQSSPATDASYRAVQALDANLVWVAGSKGSCLRTSDGGQTWQLRSVKGAEALDFRALAAFDASTVILVSAGEASEGKARIYRTTDGGESWSLVFETVEQGAFLDGIAFWNRDNGLVLGDPVDGAWFLLQTHDGGESWTRIPPTELPRVLPHEAAFAASNSSLVVAGDTHAWIASGGASHARVFRSTNRGETWQVTDTPMMAGATAGIFALHFWDARRGIGVGGDHQEMTKPSGSVLTNDAGLTWQRGGSPNPPGLKEAVVVLAPRLLLAVGPSGTSMSRDQGRSWRNVDSKAFHAASCAQGQCWAVGGKGVIAKWK